MLIKCRFRLALKKNVSLRSISELRDKNQSHIKLDDELYNRESYVDEAKSLLWNR